MANKNEEFAQKKKKKQAIDPSDRRKAIARLLIPVILGAIAVIILIILGLNRFVFKFYLEEDGYAIPKTVSLSALNTYRKESASLYKFGSGDPVYSLVDNDASCYIGDEKENISAGFPTFTRDGKVLYFVNNNTNLLTNEFNELETYEGLRLSDGVTYNSDDSKADEDEIILVNAEYGYHLAQDTTISASVASKTIPMNTICNFAENRVDCYEFHNGELDSYTITMYENSTIAIGDNEYNYKDFLMKLGLWKQAEDVQPIEKDKDKGGNDGENTNTKRDRKSNATDRPSDVFQQPEAARENTNPPQPGRKKPAPTRNYQEPTVTFGLEDIEEWVYTINVPVTIDDPSAALKGGVQIYAYEIIGYDEDGKPKLDDQQTARVTVSKGTGGTVVASVGQLKPNTEYWFNYAYAYNNELNRPITVRGDLGYLQVDEETQRPYKTLDYSSANAVSFSFDDYASNHSIEVTEDSFQIKNLFYSRSGFYNNLPDNPVMPGDSVISHFNDYQKRCTEAYISVIRIDYVEGHVEEGHFPISTYSSQFLNNAEVALLKKGFKMEKWDADNVLKSGTEYTYRIVLLDKYGHQYDYTGSNQLHYANTSKKTPKVNITIPAKTNKAGSVVVTVEWRNEDNCDITGGSNLFLGLGEKEMTKGNGSRVNAILVDENNVPILDEDGNEITFNNVTSLPVTMINGQKTSYRITNLPTYTAFNAYVICDNFDNLSGTPHINEVLKKPFSFISGSLSNYGSIRYSGYADEITDKAATLHVRFAYNKNETYFEKDLLWLLHYIDVNITSDGEETQTFRLLKEELVNYPINFSTEADSQGYFTANALIPVHIPSMEEYVLVDASFGYKLSIPEYNEVNSDDTRPCANVWEFIMATSNSNRDCYMNIKLNQRYQIQAGHEGESQRLINLKKSTKYLAKLDIVGSADNEKFESVTSSSSIPIQINTTKQDPIANIADIYVADDYIILYNLSVTDEDNCIAEDRTGTGNDARIEIREFYYDANGNYVDAGVVATSYFRTKDDDGNPIEYPSVKIDGLTKDKHYTVKVLANEYQNVTTQSSYPMIFGEPFSDFDNDNYVREYRFIASGKLRGNIDLDSLYRSYTDVDGNKVPYVGLLPSTVLTSSRIGDGSVDGDDKGWIYDGDTNTYTSTYVKVGDGDQYSLFTTLASKSNSYLPNMFEPLDYIQSSGIQYIKTGYFHNKNTEIYAEYQPIRSGIQYNHMFGARTTTTVPDAWDFGFDTTNNTYFSDYLYRISGDPDDPILANLIIDDWANYHTLKVSNAGMQINGKEIVPFFTEQQELEQGLTIGDSVLEDYLFSMNSNGTATANGASIKLRSFVISENGLVLMNFVPAAAAEDIPAYLTNINKKVPAGTAGLYETVSGKFFINSGTGNFSYPNSDKLEDIEVPDGLKKVSYIEANGTQFIATGYKHNNKTVIDTVIKPQRRSVSPTWAAIYGARTSTIQPDTWDFGYNDSTNYFFLNTSAANLNSIGVVPDYSEFITIHLDTMTFSANGVAASTGVNLIGDSNKQDYIFNINGNNATTDAPIPSHAAYFKLKMFKISEDGAPVRFFIPVQTTRELTTKVSSNGVVSTQTLPAGKFYLYDAVEGIVYVNSDPSGSDFLGPEAGEEVDFGSLSDSLKLVKYIKSNGTQYIDTGLNSKFGYHAQIKFDLAYVPSSTTWQHLIGGHDTASNGRNTKDGSAGWHHSMLRFYGNSMRIGYNNDDRYPVTIPTGRMLEVQMSIMDDDNVAGSDNYGYLRIKNDAGNFDEVWNSRDIQPGVGKLSRTVIAPIYLFAGAYPTNAAFSYGRFSMYYCKIQGFDVSGNPLERDFIPAVSTKTIPGEYTNTGRSVGPNTAGLYDQVTGKFFINSNTSSFEYGDFDVEATVEKNSSYTITLYEKNEDNTYTELSKTSSELLSNGNIFTINASNATNPDNIFARIQIVPTSDEFRLDGVYFEHFEYNKVINVDYPEESRANLLSDLSTKKNAYLEGYSYDENGNRTANEGYAVTTEYTEVLPDSVYYLTGLNSYERGEFNYTSPTDGQALDMKQATDPKRSTSQIINFYNKNKEFISSANVGAEGSLFKTPSNATYARFVMRANLITADEEAEPAADNTIVVNTSPIDDSFKDDTGDYLLDVVEYIEGDSTNWLETDYVPKKNTRWELDYQFIRADAGQVGSGNTSAANPTGANSNFFLVYLSGGTCCFAVGTTNIGTKYSLTTGRHSFVIDAGKGEAYIDENLALTYAPVGDNTRFTQNLTFFARHNTDNDFYLVHGARLFGSKIKELNGDGSYSLIHDFVPTVVRTGKTVPADKTNTGVKAEAGTAGLYDRVTKKFYMSKRDSNLAYGAPTHLNNPSIPYATNTDTTFTYIPTTEDGSTPTPETYTTVEYVESFGGQLFDTGVVPTANTEVEMEFEQTNTAGYQAIVGSYWAGNSFMFDTQSNLYYYHGNSLASTSMYGTASPHYVHPEIGKRTYITYGKYCDQLTLTRPKYSGNTFQGYVTDEYGNMVKNTMYQWKWERYPTHAMNVTELNNYFDKTDPNLTYYFCDSGLKGKGDNWGNNYTAKASTWVYVENDCTISVNFASDDAGATFVRYADSSSATHVTDYIQLATNISCKWSGAKNIPLKKGWNEIVQLYTEGSGGDWWDTSPHLDSLSQIVARSCDNPYLTDTPAGNRRVSIETMANAEGRNITLLGIDNKSVGIVVNINDTFNSRYYALAKMYFAKIYNGSSRKSDTIIRDYIPVVRQTDGIAGIYDLVNNTFVEWTTSVTPLAAGKIVQSETKYEVLNYIETTGQQYLDARVFPWATYAYTSVPYTSVEMDYMPTSIAGTQCLSGVLWGGNAFLLDLQSNQYMIHANGTSVTNAVNEVRHTFAYSNDKVRFDRSERVNVESFANAKNSPIKLLGFGAKSYNAYARLYSVKINQTANGVKTVSRDLVPVKRLSDGEIGLFDVVRDAEGNIILEDVSYDDNNSYRFYKNLGGGEFLAPTEKGTSDLAVGVEKLVTSYGKKYKRADSPYEYIFVPEMTGTYTFFSLDAIEGDPYIELRERDADRTLIAKDDDSAGDHNFKLSYDLIGGKEYAVYVSTSNMMLANAFEYKLMISDNSYTYIPETAGLYLYSGADLENFTARFSSLIEQDLIEEGSSEHFLKDGTVKIKLFKTIDTVSQSTNLDDYTDDQWGPAELIYSYPDPTRGDEKILGNSDYFPEVPLGNQPEYLIQETPIQSGYGYKAELYATRAGTTAEMLLDSVNFVATQPVYVIKDIPTLKAVANDMSGYYICVADIDKVDFTVSDQIFTGVIDWQGHTISLTSSNYLFNKLGKDAVIKNGDIKYEKTSEVSTNYEHIKDADGNDLPFIKLDYIESTGTQYLVTRIQQTATTSYKFDYERTNYATTEQNIVGSEQTGQLCIRTKNDGISAYARVYNGKNYSLSNLDLNKRVTYELSSTEFTVNDGTKHSTSISIDSYTGGSYVTVFALNTSGSTKAYGKLYNLEIYQDGNLVFNGIPAMTTEIIADAYCQDMGNKLPAASATTGLYDTVSGNFFYSYYNFDYPELPYDDDVTIAENWIDEILPDALSNEVPMVKFPGWGKGLGDNYNIYNYKVAEDGVTLIAADDPGKTYKIPQKYARVEYIQSDGRAWINTRFRYVGGVMYCEYVCPDRNMGTNSHFVMGAAQNSPKQGYYASNFKAHNGKYQSFNGGYCWSTSLVPAGHNESWIWNSGNTKRWKTIIDNGAVYNAGNSTTQYWTANHTTLFSESGGGSTRIRIYSCYMSSLAGILNRYMLPCLALEDIPGEETDTGKAVPAGTYGYFDTVTKLFYVNCSTTKGADLSGPVAEISYSDSSKEIKTETACIAKYNYGTITNTILHYAPKSASAYTVAENSAGYALYNYGTIDRFAMEYGRNIYVKNNVAGVALHNYGTIQNGFVSGAIVQNSATHQNEKVGLVHRKNVITTIRGVKTLDWENPDSTNPHVYYMYLMDGNETNAGYISYITSYNHNKATVSNVYVVNDLRIQSDSSSSGAYGGWTYGSNYLADGVVRAEYIENIAHSYIDTGHTPTANTEVEVQWQATSNTGNQEIFGSKWSGNGFMLDIQGNTYGYRFHGNDNANGAHNVNRSGAGYTYWLPSLDTVDTIHYGLNPESVFIRRTNSAGKETEMRYQFKWERSSNAATGVGTVPTMADFASGKIAETRYYLEQMIRTSAVAGEKYKAKVSTWLYADKAFTATDIAFGADDCAALYYKGIDDVDYTFAGSVTGCGTTTKTVVFKQGWNELCLLYTEWTGGDRAWLDNYLKHPEILKQTAEDPRYDTWQNVPCDRLTALNGTITLFGDKATTSYPAYGKMYGFKIWEEGVLIHDLVPAVASDDLDGSRTNTGNPVLRGTFGMYDLVGEDHLFYTNSNSVNDSFVGPSIFDVSALNTDYSALLCGYNEGTITDSFTVGDTLDVHYAISNSGLIIDESTVMRRSGPAVGACVDSYGNKNINYVSLENVTYTNDLAAANYMHSHNSSSEVKSLYDYTWYRSMLGEDGDTFRLRSSISTNLFPQLIMYDNFSTSKIPTIQLPTPEESLRIIGSEVREKGVDADGYQNALVTILMANNSSIHIDNVKIVDSNGTPLQTAVYAQGFVDGNYRVDVLIKYDDDPTTGTPPRAENGYNVISYIKSGVEHGFNYSSGENRLDISFYHIINAKNQWKDLLGGVNRGEITENYKLTTDLFFENSTDYYDWVVFGDFQGKLDGGIYNNEEVLLKDYTGKELTDEFGSPIGLFVDKELTGMHTISGVGNVLTASDGTIEYLTSRSMGALPSVGYPYDDVNAVRACLFAHVSGEISNLVFSNFKNVYLQDRPNSHNDVTAAVSGVIATATSGSVIDNCHVRNSEFATRGYGGSLVGYASNVMISNCSTRNSTVTAYNAGNCTDLTYIGGLVGYAYNTQIQSCFTSNITADGSNVDSLVGAGGIAGAVDSTDFYACYAGEGSVVSSGDCAGGIVGKVGSNANVTKNEYNNQSSIRSCWTTITVQAGGDFAGGLAGYMGIYNGKEEKLTANKILNNYTSSTVLSMDYNATHVSRLSSHTYENKDYFFDNFAFEKQSLNYKNNNATSFIGTYQFGPTNDLNGASRLLSRENVSSSNTWLGEIGLDEEYFDFSVVDNFGVMPKLYNTKTGELLYDQASENLAAENSSRLELLSVVNNTSTERLEVELALYNSGWNQEEFAEYAHYITGDDQRKWDDLAKWDQMSVIGARVFDRGEGDYLKIKPTGDTVGNIDDVGLVFKATLDYGDEEIGHYSDAYLVSLPTYLNNPTSIPRLSSGAYALIALDENNVAAKNIHSADDWDEFFKADGRHYNSLENIRLFTTDEYNFSSSKKHAYNAAIQKIYISGDDEDASGNINYARFSGVVDYGLYEDGELPADISFISQVGTEMKRMRFTNFSVDYNKNPSTMPQGLIGNVVGEVIKDKFDNVEIKGTTSTITGLIGQTEPGSSISNVILDNVSILVSSSSTAGGYGGLVGKTAGSASRHANVSDIEAYDVMVYGITGNNANTGGLIGDAEYTDITNIKMDSNDAAPSQVPSGSSLPDGFQELEYIAGTRGASNVGPVIITQHQPNTNYTLTVDSEMVVLRTDTWTTVAGTRSGNTKFSLWINTSNRQFYPSFGAVTDRYLSPATTVTLNRRYKYTISGVTGIKIEDARFRDDDGNLLFIGKDTQTYTKPSTVNNIVIGGIYDGNNTLSSWQRIYSAKIYDGTSAVIANYIPVVTTRELTNITVCRDGTPISGSTVPAHTSGLYDTYAGVFCTTRIPSGSINNQPYSAFTPAQFICGPAIKDKGYSHVTGTTSVGGVVGLMNYSTLDTINISNISVMGEGNNVGGIVGLARNSILRYLNNMSYTYVSSGGDIVGGVTGDVNADLDVIDMFASTTTMDNVVVSGKSYVGGAYGITRSSKFDVQGLTLTNVDVTGTYQFVGGFIGERSGSLFELKFDDCHFDNVWVANDASANDTENDFGYGGLIGDNVNSRQLSIYNSTFNNMFVKGLTHVGGLIGRNHDDSFSTWVQLDNVQLSNLTIESTQHSGRSTVGGVVGQIHQSSLYFDNGCTVDNVKVTSAAEETGGVLGNFYRSGTTNIEVVGAHDSYTTLGGEEIDGTLPANRFKVNNVQLIIAGNWAGGVFGKALNNQTDYACVQNTDIDHVDIYSANRVFDVGGIAGQANYVRNITLGSKDSASASSQFGATLVDNKYSLYIHGKVSSNIGGAVGILGNTNAYYFTTENVQIYNARIAPESELTNTDEEVFVAGFGGQMHNGNVKNCIVENATIEGYEHVGGFYGQTCANYTTTTNDCHVKDVIVSSYKPGSSYVGIGKVGGFIGSNNGKGDTFDCDVTHSVVMGNSYVGGITGYQSNATFPLHDCHTVDCIVLGLKQYVGGITGAFDVNQDIYNCYVTNSNPLKVPTELELTKIGESLTREGRATQRAEVDIFKNTLLDIRSKSYNFGSSSEDVDKPFTTSSSFVLYAPQDSSGTAITNSCGGIVGYFKGRSLHDCYISANTYVASHTKVNNTFTSTGGVVGYVATQPLEAQYDRVDYIRSTQKEQISTEIKANNNMTFVFDAKLTKVNYGRPLGFYHSSTAATRLLVQSATKGWEIYHGGACIPITDNYAYQNARRQYTFQTVSGNSFFKYVKDDGSENVVQSDTTEFTVTAQNIGLFALYGYSSTQQPVTLYSMKIYKGDNITADNINDHPENTQILVGDFIPVIRRSDKAPGMFDTITSKFYPNVGSGTLAYGSFNASGAEVDGTITNKSIGDEIVYNCIVDANVVTSATDSSIVAGTVKEDGTNDIHREATGGIIGAYSYAGLGQVSYMANENIDDGTGTDTKVATSTVHFAPGKDFATALGVDASSFDNFLFRGNVYYREKGDMGVGLIKVTKANETFLYDLEGDLINDRWAKIPATDYNTNPSTYIYYNVTGGGTPSYATKPSEIVEVPMNYDGSLSDREQPNKFYLAETPYFKGLTTVKLSNLGRFRIKTESVLCNVLTNVVTKGNQLQGGGNVLKTWEVKTSNGTVVDSNNKCYIQPLSIENCGNTNLVLLYGDASKGNMGLNKYYWESVLSGEELVTANTYRPALTTLSRPNDNNIDVEMFVDKMSVYPSGIDSVNVELNVVPTGSMTYTFESRNGSISGRWPYGERTITLNYDFNSDLSITLEGNDKVATKVIPFADISNTVMTYDDSFWYIYDGKVINSNKRSTGDDITFIHMYDGKLLDTNHKIYDAKLGEVIGEANHISLAEGNKPLWTGLVLTGDEDYVVRTYSQYSLSNTNSINGRVYVKNNTLFTLSTPSKIVGGPIVDTYGGNRYATVLLDNGKLLDLGTPLVYPENFKNEGIRQISSSENYSGTYALVRYHDGTLTAFNYLTGEEVDVTYEEPSLTQTFANFFRNSLKNISLKNNTPSNKAAKSLENATIYENNVNSNVEYAKALESINDVADSSKGNNTNEGNASPITMDADKENEMSALENAEVSETEETNIPSVSGEGDSIDVENDDTLAIENGENTSIKDMISTGDLQEFKIENSFVALYNEEKDESEIYDVSEVLSKPEEERISEEEKAKILADLGLKTIMPAKEVASQNTANGIALLVLVILALFSLVGTMFYIRKKNFSDEK